MKKLIAIAALILLAVCSLRAQDIEFQSYIYDFGDIEKNETVIKTCQFTFKNTGTENLVIEKISTGCPCVTAKVSPKAIKPGKTGTLSVTFDGKNQHLGAFKKSVTLTSNAKTKYIRVFIKGNMVAPNDKENK